MAVTVYQNPDFKGKNHSLRPGKYAVVPTLGTQTLSSVKVEPGTYAQFFTNRGFRDSSFILFEGEYKNLGSMDNKVDSLKVFAHDADMFPLIEFYEGRHFEGFKQTLAGTGQVTNFGAPFLRHDYFSSVKVPKGVTVTLFAGSNQSSSSLTLEPGNYVNLDVFGFDNKVSSIQIRQNNLEVINIEYVDIDPNDGDPVLIESTAQNDSNLEQEANLTLETAYEESFTRSFSNSTLFGLEISKSATVSVSAGPVEGSLSQTITASFENTFTFGEEETKTKTISVSKGLNIAIPPGNIARAVMTLTPRTATILAKYTLRLKGTDKKTVQDVTIEVKSASVGTAVIEKFTPVEA